MVRSDLQTVLDWRNHPEIRRYMLTQHEISIDEHLAWFERSSHDLNRKLLIVEEGELAFGFVNFSNVSHGGITDWGFFTDPNSPKGSGRKLGKVALDFVFGVIGVHKVNGQALSFNKPSIHFHRRLGFVQEGVLREQYCIEGAYFDLFCFGILASEWALKLIGTTECPT